MSFDPEMAAALSIFSKTCQKSISLADILQLHKYQELASLNVTIQGKDNKAVGNSGYGKRVNEKPTSSFSVFLFFQL